MPFIRDLRMRFWSKVEVTCPDRCWLWKAGRTKTGYGQFKIVGRSPQKAHRIAYELAHGPIPNGPGYHGYVVMHVCDTPLCCNPGHLRLGTVQDNLRDMTEKGRRVGGAHGSRNPVARLTEDQVRYIRSSSRSARSIAIELGVSPRAAQKIRARTRWSHLP